MTCWNCGSELDTITAEDFTETGSCSIMCPNGHKNDAFLNSGLAAKPLPWWQNGLIYLMIAGFILLIAAGKEWLFPG